MFVVDSSVAIPTLTEGHRRHHSCWAFVEAHHPSIAGHARIETYAVMTRLPNPDRAAPEALIELLDSNFPETVWPSAPDLASFLARCAQGRIQGGATYDALVALAATSSGATLVTLDRRARQTYRSIGVNVAYPDDLL